MTDHENPIIEIPASELTTECEVWIWNGTSTRQRFEWHEVLQVVRTVDPPFDPLVELWIFPEGGSIAFLSSCMMHVRKKRKTAEEEKREQLKKAIFEVVSSYGVLPDEEITDEVVDTVMALDAKEA